ncbi:MAG TPA: hypothetical protein EYP04_01265, partial [Anaerolineae bacterium]|nr:hypothetical protein [Anaerolineae bacterium]
MAAKHNDNPDQMDITVWQWVTTGPKGKPTCAGCHPGGGPLEFDREGNRYDQYLVANPGLAETLDGDYYKSHWDKSGVLEADCLMCHSPDYQWKTRIAQLKAWNLKWAATAAGGLGIVKGKVIDGDTPTVTYNTRLFNADGKIVLNINYHPADDNCIQCHGPSDMKKRGFSWNDLANPDVHNQQGIHCVDCHPGDINHNFAKGHTIVESVRDDLDNTMRSCEECHTTGYLGASIPDHINIPPSHLENLACETCHIPYKNRAAGLFFDSTHGGLNWDVVGEGEKIGQKVHWQPSYKRREDGKIYPVNPIFGVWWGNRDKTGKVWPLFGKEIKKAWELVKDQVTDANGDGYAEVNTRDEIAAMLKAFDQTLADNQRF